MLQSGTCVSSRELRVNVSPTPFVVVRTGREVRLRGGVHRFIRFIRFTRFTRRRHEHAATTLNSEPRIPQGRKMILLQPEIESEEGDVVEAVVEDARCAAPLKVRRHARAVVSFVDGGSPLSRLAGVRERLRFFQPTSLCVQLALGKHPCE